MDGIDIFTDYYDDSLPFTDGAYTSLFVSVTWLSVKENFFWKNYLFWNWNGVKFNDMTNERRAIKW